MAESTFKKYTAGQAAQYAIQRGASYPEELYQQILSYHESNHGQWRCLLDVGCGPGKSTHDLAPFYDRAIGIDHSQAMVDAAASAGYQAKSSSVQFLVAGAEDFDKLDQVQDSGIDMLTAGMAAHWFDMNVFWRKAARVLAPGGTVALWTYSSLFCHPDTPNAKAVQEILLDFENNVLGKYALPGNIVSQHMYEDLGLPWTISPPETGFNRSLFLRKEWNRDGKLDPNQSDFLGGFTTTLQEMSDSNSTASMYTRWAEDNPELAGTEDDCVKVKVRKIKSVSGLESSDVLKLGCGIVLLLFSRQ